MNLLHSVRTFSKEKILKKKNGEIEENKENRSSLAFHLDL